MASDTSTTTDDRIDPENIAHPETPRQNTGDERYEVMQTRDHDRYGNIRDVILYDHDTDEYVIASYRTDGRPSNRKVKSRFTLDADAIDRVEYDPSGRPDHSEFDDWAENYPADVAMYVEELIHGGGVDNHIEEIGRESVQIYDGIADGPITFTVHFDA